MDWFPTATQDVFVTRNFQGGEAYRLEEESKNSIECVGGGESAPPSVIVAEVPVVLCTALSGAPVHSVKCDYDD